MRNRRPLPARPSPRARQDCRLRARSRVLYPIPAQTLCRDCDRRPPPDAGTARPAGRRASSATRLIRQGGVQARLSESRRGQSSRATRLDAVPDTAPSTHSTANPRLLPVWPSPGCTATGSRSSRYLPSRGPPCGKPIGPSVQICPPALVSRSPIRSFRTSEGRNTTTRRAAIGAGSQVFGLRPMRGFLSRVTKAPGWSGSTMPTR